MSEKHLLDAIVAIVAAALRSYDEAAAESGLFDDPTTTACAAYRPIEARRLEIAQLFANAAFDHALEMRRTARLADSADQD